MELLPCSASINLIQLVVTFFRSPVRLPEPLWLPAICQQKPKKHMPSTFRKGKSITV